MTNSPTIPCKYEEELRGMPCCANGRIGDGHAGCYYEALHRQKRKDAPHDE